MENIIAKLLQEFEKGKMSRRHLIKSIAVAATAAVGREIKAIGVNHISYQVHDYRKTRDFYVNLFGAKIESETPDKQLPGAGVQQCRLRLGNALLIPRSRARGIGWHGEDLGPTPLIDHISFTIENWDQESVLAELKRRNIRDVREEEHLDTCHILDPDGFQIQFGGADQ